MTRISIVEVLVQKKNNYSIALASFSFRRRIEDEVS
jgi:hypothetical protein